MQADAAKAPEASKQGKDKKQAKANKKAAAGGGDAVDIKTLPVPDFVQQRLAMWSALKAEHDRELAAKERKPITVTLPNGTVKQGQSWETTPLAIAKEIRVTLAKTAVVARVNGELWDLARPLEVDCTLELLEFDNADAANVFWHSSAHVLGAALERLYGGKLCTGPPIEGGGFFYDVALADQRTVTPADFPTLQALVNEMTRAKAPFEMMRVPREKAEQMFGYSDFKREILSNKVPEADSEGVGSMCTVYRCGNLVDLCRGPHVVDTGRLSNLAVWKNSSAYWKGDAKNAVLQRVYGVSFPEKKQLEDWQKRQEALEAKSHLAIGTRQQLFFVEPHYSPGSTFWLPHGARIYNKLISFIRGEYTRFGFTEVITPNMYNNELWTTSGHFPKYEKDMFILEVDKTQWALKPMNCPGHCVMFKHLRRSYRELPIRFADFGVLHRNEAVGALRGLTRVRRFQQDDAHIFCSEDDIQSEVLSQLNFMKRVYGIFNYQFSLELSTRPENALGELAVWEKAEANLEKALNHFGHPWKLNKGDGAFYGPKIDVHIQDSLGRSHQCATVQLDFQLPIRFQLEYAGKDNKSDEVLRPVMIHRAIYGSLERFLGILMEHIEGKWPLWLSPRQFMVIPVSKANTVYAESVKDTLVDAGFFADVDVSGKTLDKKVLEHSLYNYLLVVGGVEETNKSVNVRKRKQTDDEEQVGREVPLHTFINEISEEIKKFL